MSYDFNKKNIFITGASSGIGAEFAKQFHNLGANVLLVARRSDKLNQLRDQLNSQRPISAQSLVKDLTNKEDLEFLSNYIQKNKIDVLVNNAGRGSFGYFGTLDVENELDQINLNISATLKLAHAIIPQLKKRRSGGIISVSSIAAFQPLPLMATYAGTKSFNFMHSIAIREELKNFNVHVTALCPGPTKTEFGQAALVPDTLSTGPTDNVSIVVKRTITAFKRNRAFVIPSKRAFLLSFVSRLFPKTISTQRVGKMLISSLGKNK